MSVAFATPAFAKDATKEKVTAWDASRTVDDNDKITTGVAKARDCLSSAISTSSIKENEIDKLARRSMADPFRAKPATARAFAVTPSVKRRGPWHASGIIDASGDTRQASAVARLT